TRSAEADAIFQGMTHRFRADFAFSLIKRRICVPSVCRRCQENAAPPGRARLNRNLSRRRLGQCSSSRRDVNWPLSAYRLRSFDLIVDQLPPPRRACLALAKCVAAAYKGTSDAGGPFV